MAVLGSILNRGSVLLLAALAAWPTTALGAPEGVGPTNPSEASAIALENTVVARDRLTRYLSGSGARSQSETARLTVALIGDLGQRSAVVDFGTLKSAIDRVVDVAGEVFAGARIYNLGIERGYRPAAPVLALDFGSVGNPPLGFQRVLVDDPRLAGRNMVVARGDLEGVLGAGILGVHRIELTVPDDAYRVVLLTRKANRGGTAPFGREISVNGVKYQISRTASETWSSALILPKADDPTGGRSRNRGQSAANQFMFVHRMRAAAQQGGAMLVEGWARRGKLIIELAPLGLLPTYITGLLVEPASKWSDLEFGSRARQTHITLHQRLGFRERIESEAGRVLAGAAPSRGAAIAYSLPAPIIPRTWWGRRQ